MGENGFLKLDVDKLHPEANVSAIPTMADRVRQHHAPGRHQRRALLSGRVLIRKELGQQIPGRQADFLGPHCHVRLDLFSDGCRPARHRRSQNANDREECETLYAVSVSDCRRQAQVRTISA